MENAREKSYERMGSRIQLEGSALDYRRNTTFIVTGEKQVRTGKDTADVWIKNGAWRWVQKFQDVERVPVYWLLVSLGPKKED